MKQPKSSISQWIVLHPYLVGTFILFIALLVASPYLLDAFWGNARIIFYGRVVDENGNGVEGAEVTMNVAAIKRLSIPVPFAVNQTGWIVKAVTAQGGNFTVRGGNGISIQLVDIKKSGYGLFILTQSGSNFVYTSQFAGVAPYRPDPRHPAIFRLPHLK